MLQTMNSLILVFPLLQVLKLVPESEAHGRLMEPPNRSSVWRDSRFDSYNPPKNYNDMELFCGRGNLQEDHPGSNCGVCGDPLSDPQPRPNEMNGQYYRGIITGNYKSGQEIDITVDIIAAHQGFFEWRLCTNPQNENQECFNQNLLQRADGQGTRQYIMYDTGIYKTKLKLPKGVACSQCIIQWNYRAENRWGYCNNGTSGLGCGPQEVFRGCSDVTIV